MLLSLPAMLTLMALVAPGDIYRCQDASGRLSYQDTPCSSGSSARLPQGEDGAASQRALQQWLDQQRGHAAAPTHGDEGKAAPRPRPLLHPDSPVSEAQLAGCSERFLHCASHDAQAMDRCIGQLPRCSRQGSGACCPQACIDRYQTLRKDGSNLASAVRLALLDPDSPACAVR